MHGPTAAAIRAGAAPRPTMAATVASRMPASAPFQPAWAAPITPASGSASSTGPQSAASTPRSRPGRSVTRASASGASRVSQGAVDLSAVAPWTWRAVTSRSAGAQGRSDARPVGGDPVGSVAAAQPDIEGAPDTLADAALAAEESVPNPGQGRPAQVPSASSRVAPPP